MAMHGQSVSSTAMDGQSDFFDVPNVRRDLTREAIGQIFAVTRCKATWRARPNRGPGKKLSATGPMDRCTEAVQMAMRFMQAEEAPELPAATAEDLDRMEEGAAHRRAAHSGHRRFQVQALPGSQTVSFLFGLRTRDMWSFDGLV